MSEVNIKWNVSSNPHVRSKVTTGYIMFFVVLSLLPATGFGIYNFGIRALWHVLLTVGACVIAEALFGWRAKKVTVSDLSAVVTGLLLALNLPVSAPLWIGPMGGVFAIVVVKMLFGGLGQNFMNPALGARCFLLISFTGRMTNFTLDGVSQATPLAVIKNADSSVSVLDTLTQGGTSLWDMFLGNIGGTIGETSAVALLIGAAYLFIRRIISWEIPFCYIGTFAVFALLFGGYGFDLNYLAAQLCGGGLLLGAFFMATDYVTCPITKNGRIIFGICLGLLTGIFRIYGGSAEGVSYAIIFCNLLVPLIERVTIPKPFGFVKEKTEK